MRIVTLEEHISLPGLVAQIPDNRKPGKNRQRSMPDGINEKLADLDSERMRSMDESGISTQVISVVGETADLLEPREAIPFASAYNDRMAEAIARHPGKLAAFAHLPMVAPE